MIVYDNKDWWRLTFALHGTVLPRIWGRVLFFGALTSAIWGVDQVLGWKPQCDPLAHTLVGICLGLLLVFRNSASYERYWEGRRCWGSIVNTARNLARGAAAYAGDGQELAKVIAAYVLALKQRLRGETDLAELEPFVPAQMIAEAAAAANPPSMLARRMSAWLQQRIVAGRLTPQQAITLEGHVCELLNNQGACERILKTPIPFGHAAHIRQLLMLYLVTLPLILVPKMSWVAIPAMVIVSFGLIGIEEAGVEIEDPFGTDPNDLPLDTLCETIARDTQQLADVGPGA